jgi:CBS domain-containing protein
MKIKEVMTKNPQSVSSHDKLSLAAEKMKSLDVGFIPVVDDGKISGVLTDRDIIIRAIAKHKDPEKNEVNQFMSSKFLSCFDDDDIEKAVSLMEEKQIRRLPVINHQKKLVGVVSLGDLALETHNQKLSGEILEKVSEHRNKPKAS